MFQTQVDVVYDLYVIEMDCIVFCSISSLHYTLKEVDQGLIYVPSYTNKHSSQHNCPKAKKLCLWFGVVGFKVVKKSLREDLENHTVINTLACMHIHGTHKHHTFIHTQKHKSQSCGSEGNVLLLTYKTACADQSLNQAWVMFLLSWYFPVCSQLSYLIKTLSDATAC